MQYNNLAASQTDNRTIAILLLHTQISTQPHAQIAIVFKTIVTITKSTVTTTTISIITIITITTTILVAIIVIVSKHRCKAIDCFPSIETYLLLLSSQSVDFSSENNTNAFDERTRSFLIVALRLALVSKNAHKMISANDTKLKLLNESNRSSYNYKPPVKRSSISVINSNSAQSPAPQPTSPSAHVLSSSSVTSPTSPKSIQSMSPTSQLHTGTQSIKTSTHSINNNKRMSMHTISRNSVSSASRLRSRHSPSSKDPSVNRAAAATAAAQAARETPLFEDPFYRAKQFKKQRKQDIQKRFTDIHHSHNTNANKSKSSQRSADNEYKTAQCHFTFIFDPNGRLSYWMGFIVSLAFLYNFWVIIYRYSFNEINSKSKFYWFMFDYFADFLYICDILFNFRTGFLEEGVLQTDPTRLRHYYMNTTRFYVDCLCLIPLDILYLSIGYNSILRCFRLVKIYRFWEFLDRTERHTNFPNFFRTVVMLHYLFAIFHWNACFSYFLSRYLSDELVVINHKQPPSVHSQQQPIPLAGNAYFYANEPHKSAAIYFNNEPLNINHNTNHNNDNNKNFQSIPVVTLSSSSSSSSSPSKASAFLEETRFKYKHKPFDPYNTHVDLLKEYLKAFYMSTKIMTLVSEMPNPRTSRDFIFSIIQLIFALLLFATIMGHVGYIVSNLGNARKEFQSKLDGVKTYMSLRRVPKRLQDRVIRWFDFLWGNHKSIDDNQILNLLPYKLRAEIAIHVHLDTLKRVEIFQNTEAGFLNELVLRLKPVLYSPGDFICRKGEVGKEMYIVSAGKLQVISDDGKAVLATLKAGSYFGEISILNMGASGNRRTASVKSVGYSDLFCLSKEDLWEVLKEYPAVRVKLEAIAVRRLEKHKKPLSEIVNIKRCKSAPGLLQISLATPPVPKVLKRYGTLPATLLKRTDISLVLSNNYSASASTSNMKKKKSIQDKSNDKRTDNEKAQVPKRQLHIQTVNESNKAPAMSNQPTPTTTISTSSFNSLNNDKTLTCNTPTKVTHRKAALNDENTTSDESYFSSSRLSTTRQHYYNEKLLVDEMEKLKKYVYFLKAENLALNFKLNKYQNYREDLDMEFEINKARPESSDIDDFKV